MQYIITSAPAPNFDYVRRAGRNWPKSGTTVEVVDDQEDPKQTKDKIVMIGQKSWEALKADTRIFARPAGDIEDLAATSVALLEAREKIAALEAENADLKAHLAAKDQPTNVADPTPPAPPAPAQPKGKSSK